MYELIKSNLNFNNEKNIPASKILHNKNIIGLYFSGYHCPPCKSFTPVLTQLYEDIKEDYDDFEIIFISSDKDQDSFNKYFNIMPWYALPFYKRELKQSLCDEYNIKTIPSLVFINNKGELINKNGKQLVEKYFYNIDLLINKLKNN